MKKILFPFEMDHPQYKETYVYAVKFARNLNAELILLNAYSLDVDDNITEESYKRLVKDNWLRAYRQVSKFNKYYLESHINVEADLRIKFDYRFIHGKLLNEIKNILGKEDIDLVVLPVSDKKEFNKKQLAIIKDDIFEKNRAALLIVPFKGVFNPIKNIVFATDLKRINAHDLYFNDVIKYAKIFNSKIHFIHISPREKAFLPKETEAYKTLMEITRANEKYVFESLHGKNVVDLIQQYINNNNADLLVVVKQERFFLESLFRKSVSGEVSLRSTIPVLIIREKDIE